MSGDRHDVAGRPAKLLMRVPVDRRRPVDARVDPVRDRNDAAVGPHRADVGEDLARLSFVAGHDGLGRELKAPGELARRRRKAEMADARQTEQARSEEHTSELQSQSNLVCRLLLEKKKSNSLDPSDDSLRSHTTLQRTT